MTHHFILLFPSLCDGHSLLHTGLHLLGGLDPVATNSAHRKVVFASFRSFCALSVGPLGIPGVVWGLILLQDT